AGFGTWLYRIAINACLDHLRRRERTRPLPLEEATWVGPNGDDVAEQVADAAERADRHTALVWALDRLPAEDRLLLYLRIAEERSYEAIGELLGINSRTVGTRLYRVRARLHDLISNGYAVSESDASHSKRAER
ncbi:MAG: RNA polymerase sigma factor, partial [Dehalococcoidia bacterium]